MTVMHDLSLARMLTERVEAACEGLETGEAGILNNVTGVTAELLRYWFQQDFIDTRAVNFHSGQRQAILNALYAHEVLGTRRLSELYQAICPNVLLESGRASRDVAAPKNNYPKYCLSMATGTGKTWVLQALLVWQLLNVHRADHDGLVDKRFTRNFLLVAPGLIVYDRLLDALMGKTRNGQRFFETADLSVFSRICSSRKATAMRYFVLFRGRFAQTGNWSQGDVRRANRHLQLAYAQRGR